MARRSVRWAEELQRAVRWLPADGVAAPGQGHYGGPARTLGGARLPVCRRSRTAAGSGMESGVRRVSRVGFAFGVGELATRRAATGEHAGAALVVGLRCHTRISSIGARPGFCRTGIAAPR